MKTIKEETAWAAGLFEGEGCISSRHTKRKHRRDRGLVARLKMTDEDVVMHFFDVVRIGNVTGPYRKKGRKPVWIWQAGSYGAVRDLIHKFGPWLHQRRTTRFEQHIKDYESWGGYRK